MYLAALAASLCLSYFALSYGLTWFFSGERARMSPQAWRSVALIAAFAIGAFLLSFHIHDKQLANRFLHTFGGGVAGFLVCYLVARDSALALGRARFFIVAAAVVTAMGVGNELMEFFLQTYTPLLFSSTPVDTWLDLASNTVGILLAAALFTPLIPRGSGSALQPRT